LNEICFEVCFGAWEKLKGLEIKEENG